MKILITGGAGFIGSHVVDRYLDDGHEIEVIDNMSTGRDSNKRDGVIYHNIDIRAPEISEVFHNGNFDVVNHHAAQIDVRKSTQNPVYDAEVNIVGTINLLQYCVKTGVKQFIFASTGGAIYGEQDIFPADESHPTRPVSPYGISKLSIEKYLHFYRVEYNLAYHILRYSNVYGPRQNPHGEAGVVAIFALKLLRDEKAVINGDGKQTRDYIFAGDIARLNASVLGDSESVILNAGRGEENDVNRVFRLIRDSVGSKQEEIHGPAPPGEQSRSCIDPSLAIVKYRWKPEVELTDGIQETVEFFKRYVNSDGNVR